MPDTPTLTIPLYSLDREEVESLYRQVAAVRTNTRVTLRLDLSRVNFVFPAGVVALISIARLWYQWTKQGVCLADMKPKVHAYLERINLFTNCRPIIAQDRSVPTANRLYRSSSSTSLLEVMPIDSTADQNETDVQQAIKRTGQILQTQYGPSHPAIARLQKLVSELATNVIHSRDTGYMVVQSYHPNSVESRVDIAITDSGIGIERSLKGRTFPPPLSGSGYILMALKEGVTSQRGQRGIGLFEVHQIVAQWQGALTLRSGASRVDICARQEPLTYDNLPQIPGTQVYITAKGVFAL